MIFILKFTLFIILHLETWVNAIELMPKQQDLYCSADEYPIIEVDDGKLQGHLVTPDDGNPYYAFQEIPYAAPPVGDLRFAEPIRPQKWSGVRKATKNTKICMYKQVPFEPSDSRENEDCLYLNVFTPKLADSYNGSLLPVYVYLYGGYFINGNPTGYIFQGFLDEDIVAVSMNFRSGLGFITTGDNVIPGNLGIKDQLFALKWVNRNIAKFGGDPTKVTLGSHSSGAMLAGYHLLTEKAKGLFRSIILQSGSPLASVSLARNPKHLAFALGEKLSKDFTSKNTSEDLLKLLRSVPVEKITETDIEYPDWFDYPASGYRPSFTPIVEDPNYENSVVTGPMHDNFKKGSFNRVPILAGITSEEFIDNDDITTAALLVDTNLTAILDPTLRIKTENFLPMAKEIKDIYSKKKPFRENIPGFIKAMGDILYAMPVIKNAFLCSKYSDVYFYQFSYRTPYSEYKKFIQDEWKKPGVLGLAAHADELPLLYYFELKPDITPTIEDLQMRKKIIKMWTNFIKHTNPTPKKDPMFQNILWPTVKQTNFRFVDIDSKLSLKKNPRNFIDWQNRLEKYFDSPRYSY